MADLITKVQGAVIDLENTGGGTPGIILPTPELIEKFDVGDTWETSKEAENYYDKDYVICFDTPTIVTEADGAWYDAYKVPIAFEDTVSITPIQEIPETSNSMVRRFNKGYEYDGGMLYLTNNYQVYYAKNGVKTLLNNSNPSTTITDMTAFVDELGDRWFYGATNAGLYKATNPSNTAFYTQIYDFGERKDQYIVHQEGDLIYCVYFKGTIAGCVVVSHSGLFDPYVAWENVDLENQSGFWTTNYVRYLDEIFFKDLDENNHTVWHKMSIKSGFITRKIISFELAKVMFENTGLVYASHSTQHYGVSTTNGIGIDNDKTLLFTSLFLFYDDQGNNYYINISFSRSRGLGIILLDYNNRDIGKTIIDDRFILANGWIYKNINFNTSTKYLREVYLQIYDGIEIEDSFSNGSLVYHFYGLGDDNKNNYIVGYNTNDSKYYLCQIEILNVGDYLPQATIPAVVASDPTLQIYGRKK